MVKLSALHLVRKLRTDYVITTIMRKNKAVETVNKVGQKSICFITGTYPPIRCGIGDYTAHLAQAMSEQTEAEVSILTTDQAQNEPNHKFRLVNKISRWNWRNLRWLLNWLKATRPAIIHVQYPTTLYGRHPAITLLPLLTRLVSWSVPTWSPLQVLTIHEYSTFRLLGKIRIWLMALASHTIIVVNPETLGRLHFLRRLGKSLEYLPLASNISTELPADYVQNPTSWLEGHGVPTDRAVIAYFGFISPSKGLQTLVEAFGALEEQAQLLFIAEPKAQDVNYQAYFDKLENLIKAKNLAEKVTWTGFASETDVAAYLHSATIAVFPFVDGVSLRRTSLLAALANQVAVISTISNQGEDMQGLIDGENIRLVSPEDVQALQLALQQLLADPALRTKLAENGQKLAAKFSWPDIARQHLNLYHIKF